MIRRIVCIVLLLATPAAARDLSEKSIVCEQELTANLDPSGAPHLFVTCTTLDAQGAVIRNARSYDVTKQLTVQQRAGLLTILQKLQAYVAGSESVPTPVATP